MKKVFYTTLIQLLFFSIAFAGGSSSTNHEQATELIQTKSVQFIENKGQLKDMNGNVIPFVLFKTEAAGTNMYITEKGLTYMFFNVVEEKKKYETNHFQSKKGDADEKRKTEWNRIDMELNGASIKKENIITEEKSTDFSQYFLAHCPNGITNVHSYKKITITNVYPGIDWVFYNVDGKGFKYDFVVKPNANPQQIELIYSSQNKLKLSTDGALEINTALGTLKENAPISYQNKSKILSGFVKTSCAKNNIGGYSTHIKFNLKNYNTDEQLTIDPQLIWATFYGGSNLDALSSIASDSMGNIFITGSTYALNFPTLNAGGGTYYVGTKAGSSAADVFILKFNNSGMRIWATYYGGSGDENGRAICTDNVGNVFVSGRVLSLDLPVFDPGGGAYFQATNNNTGYSPYDAFILKFNNSGIRLWATYFGASDGENITNSMCADHLGNVFVTGYTISTNFPVFNPGGGTYFQSAPAGGMNGFIIKFSNIGTRLWATYYGGSGDDQCCSICADPSNQIYVTGYTVSTDFPVLDPHGGCYFQGTLPGLCSAFILKFDNSGTQLWSSYYGGTDADYGNSICSDFLGNIFVLGKTSSSNFPVLNAGGGAYFQGSNSGGADVFILKFNNLGIQQWATYYGGAQNEWLQTYQNIAIDQCNNVYICFSPLSVVPVYSSSGYNDLTPNGSLDLLIAKFDNFGTRLWASYFGGDGADAGVITVDRASNLFIAANCENVTSNASYPLTNPGGSSYYDGTFDPATGPWGNANDGFIAKFSSPVLNYSPIVTTAFCGCNGAVSLTSVPGTCSSNLFEWYDSTWLLIGTNQTLNGLCSGNYQAVIKDPSTGINLDTLFITIPDSTITASINGINTICSGQTTTLTATGGGTYGWSTGISTNSIIVNPTSNTTYSVIVSNGICVDTAYSIVAVTPLPVVIINGIDSICFGQSTTLTATGGGTYYWNTGVNSNAITVNPSSNTTYSVIVANLGCSDTTEVSVIVNPFPIANISGIDTICIGQSTTLIATGSGTYDWNTGANSSAVIVTPSINTNYSVIVSNGTCSDTAYTTIIVEPIPTATITGLDSICFGQSTTLVATGGGTYNWSTGSLTTSVTVNPISSTTYSVIVSTNGCSDTATTLLTVNSLPVANISGTTTICNGQNTTLTATGGGSYNWNTGVSNPTITVSPITNTNYSVVVNNAFGCADTTTKTVTVIPIPTVAVSGNTLICDGETEILTALGIGNLLWNTGDTTSLISISPSASTEYSVIASNFCGSEMDSITVAVNPLPVTTISNDTSILLGNSAPLFATGGVTYSWIPILGLSCTTCSNPVASPQNTTTYSATITGANGCTVTKTVTITLDYNDEIFVPDIFSPNDDGQNDILYVRGSGIKELSFVVYDRLGEKIFESDNITKGWDGTYKGNPLNNAVFVYYLSATMYNEKKIKMKGDITLVR